MNSLYFQEKHHAFLEAHLSRRSGERKGRLEHGHQHAEALFWNKSGFR